MATAADMADAEKAHPTLSSNLAKSSSDLDRPHHRTISDRFMSKFRAFEVVLLKYNIETRGIQRVSEDEKERVTWLAYLQAFVLWTSINLAVNNITLGMLGPAVYGLSLNDSSICAALGALLGSIPVAWIACWGPKSGVRTMVWSRYAMGWWPSKLIVILNMIVLLGYALLVAIIGGQVLSAVSPNGSMSVVVGIIIVALITWLVTTFGISVFHYYERYAFLPQLVVMSILYGVAAKNFDLTTPSHGDPRTVIGNRLSFFSICAAAAITYSGTAMDFFVYWPTKLSRRFIFMATLLGLVLSFTFTFVLGAGIASGININEEYASAWTNEQGGSGSGALLVVAFNPLGSFGKFCAVIVALGGVANMIPPTYSSGVDFQMLGRHFAKVPRVVWNTVGVIIYTVCALAGRNSLALIFTNFLALMGYWVAIWFAICLVEFLVFRRASMNAYKWIDWDQQRKLPIGIAGFVAFLVGWVGAILCMAQVWYIGPLARLVGEYGADMGNYVGFAMAGILYAPLRWIELKYFGR